MRDTAPARPVRVVLVISTLEYGGAQRQVVELANGLDPARFDVRVCSLSDYVPLAGELRDARGRLFVIRKRGRFDLTVVPRLGRWLHRLGADIVHSYLFDADIAARLAGRLARTPAVVGSERNTDYPLDRRHLVAYRLTRRCVDLIVANSRAGARFNARMLGHSPSAYRVVPNGVDLGRFAPGEGAGARRALGIGAGEPVVGMVASFKPQKNHSLLLTAARALLERQPTARLLLVGDALHGGMHGSDDYKRRILAMIDALGLRERCVLVGNQRDVAPLYRACDVTVLPSLFEGTPNVLLESMACGVPVVATDVSDNAELVPDGQVGYVVPLGDPAALAERIGRLLGDGALRRAMGARGRAWVEREFSPARLAARTAAVYGEALAARSPLARRGVPADHFTDRLVGAGGSGPGPLPPNSNAPMS